MEYYYDLDIDGKIKGRYLKNQPDKTLIKLEEPATFFYQWTGSEWIEDVDKYRAEVLVNGRQLLYTSWPDSSKTVVALKAQYDNFKSGVSSAVTISEIDTEYDDFLSFMDLS